MNKNESRMKSRGSEKVWKTIKTREGNNKNISSTQIGQQLLFEDALSILDQVRLWINEDSAKLYRAELQTYFADDEILLEKITQAYLFLAGAIYDGVDSNKGRTVETRHKKINTLQSKVMPELSFDQTWRFLEVIIELSSYFRVEKLLNYREGNYNWSLRYTCNLSELIMSKLAIEAAEAFYPMPMKEVPINWSFENGELKGGYRDYQYELVRASPREVDYSLYSEHVFDAVNYIQVTPWIVNKELLKQVREDLTIPRKEEYIKTPYPDKEASRWDIDLKDEELSLSQEVIVEIEKARAIFRESVALFNADSGDFESAIGKYRAIRLAVQIAEQYVDEVIYFPHSYDFRGRIYPLPIGLSPQGSDAVKSLLLYANTEELSEQGIRWNWAYLASLFGDDKLHFAERVERGKELIDTNYLEADEPYQFLSHQLEIRKWLEDSTYQPNTRIHLDACNSGSQFTSAITGDKAGCIATNVIPSFNPDGSQDRQDAYILVSEKALEKAEALIAAEDDKEVKKTLKFLRSLLVADGRKICKVPVMVSNYGGTSGGRAEILWNMLRELGVDRKWITKKTASLFSRIIGDSIVGVLNGGKAFETYIHKMNNVIAKDNKPIIWETSDGFNVVHVKNKELKAKQVSCILPGARRKTTITKKIYSKKVSPTKMKSAISPNYIHSLDAELLRRTALKMKRAGVSDSDWIHDSFGCHPNNVDLMLDLTKREFSKLVRRSPLYLLDQQLRSQVSERDVVAQKALAEIKIPHLRGFKGSEGGLDIVMESEWFFS